MKKTVLTKDEVIALFKNYPTVDKFYITSDGQAFHEEERGNGHAQRLKNKTVIGISRADLDEVNNIDFTDQLGETVSHAADAALQNSFAEFLALEGGNEPAKIKTTLETLLDGLKDRVNAKGLLASLNASDFDLDDDDDNEESAPEILPVIEPVADEIEPAAAPIVEAPATEQAPAAEPIVEPAISEVAPAEQTDETQATTTKKGGK